MRKKFFGHKLTDANSSVPGKATSLPSLLLIIFVLPVTMLLIRQLKFKSNLLTSKKPRGPAYTLSGFTLIELLIVIVIIAALAVTVFIALNPLKRLATARDSRRTADVETILTAIHEYIADKGSLPAGLSTSMAETQLGTSNGSGTSVNPSCAISTGGCAVSATACINLTTPLAPYLKSIPTDPKNGSASATLYSVTVGANNIVTVKACGAETGVSATPYLFGTLDTANGSIFNTLGLTYAQVAQQEHAAGVAVANVTLAWKDYETGDGVYNEGQLTWVANNIKTFLQAGQKVDVQLALHYVPSWVMQIPNAYYINQYGVKAPQVYGFDDPNYVFNATVRQKVQDFETHSLQQLNSQVGLGNILAFRVDGGDGGEAMYEPSNDGSGHTNSYWAYDPNAQGTGGNLPTGVSSSPFPGWQPGQTTYNSQPFTITQLQQWYNWYFNSRMNYYNWQIALFRTAGFNGYLPFETPGFGTRPDEYTNNMNNYLNGTYDPNGTMSRAAVWQNLYPAITNKTKIVAYISSMADGSGSPANNLCQTSDSAVNFSTDPTVDTWSAVRYVSYIANKYGLLKGGENPGYGGGGAGPDYGPVMMNNAAAQMQACGLMGMFWAHDQNLYDNTVPGFTLQTYANVIALFNTSISQSR